MSQVNVLVLANKQDVEGAMGVDEIKTKMKLNNIKDREWTILPCCAVSGQGLEDGLKWLNIHCGGAKQKKEKKTTEK